jgi:hypothetical protein
MTSTYEINGKISAHGISCSRQSGSEAFGANTLVLPGILATNNTAVGNSSLSDIVNGNNHTAVGNSSLSNQQGGIGNVAVGVNTLVSSISGSFNVAIGASAGYNETGSNKLYIANSSGTSGDALIYGEFDNGKVWIKNNPVDTFTALGSAPTPTTAGKTGQIGVYSGYLYVWSGDAVVVRVAVETSW